MYTNILRQLKNIVFFLCLLILCLVFTTCHPVQAATTVGANVTTDNLYLNDNGVIYQNNLKVMSASSTSYSTTLGIDAGKVLSNAGQYNVFLGYQAGYKATTSDYNIAIGYQALYNTENAISSSGSISYSNIAIGESSLYSNTIGYDNVAVGAGAMYANTTGDTTVAIGSGALEDNTTGYGNVAIGWYSSPNNTIGLYNTALGYQSYYYNKYGSYNTAIGNDSLNWMTEGSWNTALGSEALAYAYTKSFANTGIGYQAGRGAGGAGYSYASSTWVGYQAGVNIRTGSSNIALGYKAADNLTTGSNNIVIGYDIDAPSASGSNRMTIANAIFGTELSGTGTTIAGKIGIATSSPADLWGFTVATSTLQYGNTYIRGNATVSGTATAATSTATTALIAPSGTNPSAGDACTDTLVGAVRIDTDAAVGSRIIWCDGSNWQAN